MFMCIRRCAQQLTSCLGRVRGVWLDATGAAAAGAMLLALTLPAMTATRAEADMVRRGAVAVAAAAIAGGGHFYQCCNTSTGVCLLQEDNDNCPTGYVLVGDGNVTCMPNPCPQGRCCDLTTGGCTITGPDGCVGGSFQIGGVCEPNPCIGACCSIVTGTCTQTGPLNCPGPFTLGAACDPSPCPMVACCNIVTGECTMTGLSGCVGGPPVPGAVCDPNPCPMVACCNITTGQCTMTAPGGCPGGPTVPGTVCDPNPCPMVACCNFATAECSITGPGGCSTGPTFPATTCTPNPCPMVACCNFATAECSITGPGGCSTGPTFPATTCTPNPCPMVACCNVFTGACAITAPGACMGPSSPLPSCNPTPCQIGACCDPVTGDCTITGPAGCPGRPLIPGTCNPTSCPIGACCNPITRDCTITGPAGCPGMPLLPGACTPNPCPGACCNSATGLCTFVAQGLCTGSWIPANACTPSICPPVAKAKDVVVDVRGVCGSTNVTARQVDDGSFSGTPMCPVTLELIPSGPYPVGLTQVTLKVTDCNGKMSTANATITVLGADCDHNGINDFCECYWENADMPFMRGTPVPPPPAGGQLSHIGGGTAGGARVADDFWVCAGQVDRISGFSGLMLTNSTPGVRKARLEFYEDCDGRPAATPFHVSTKSTVAHEYPGPGGYAVVEYSFDLCDDPLWLDGGPCGQTYWVALIGVSDNQGSDVSFWVTAPEWAKMIGSVPVKADGTVGPTWGSVVWGPWAQVDECCGGCVNMVFSLRGSACKVVWENGPPDLRPATLGGTFSGAAGAGTARTADNFVIPPCDPVEVCLIEAWVWTNCIPPHGSIEIYNNDCKTPNGLAYTVAVDRAVETTETATIDGVLYRLYKLQAYPVGLTLPGGHDYWLSAVVNSGGSLNGRTLFAYNDTTCRPNGVACPIRISPGQTRAITPVLADEWTVGARDYAFRIAIHKLLVLHTRPDVTPALPICRADANSDGSVTVDDLFSFMNAWFVGCP